MELVHAVLIDELVDLPEVNSVIMLLSDSIEDAPEDLHLTYLMSAPDLIHMHSFSHWLGFSLVLVLV